jgi:hypothetical protein
MKKVQSLSKFKNNELNRESLTAIVGGTVINTTFSGGNKGCDVFNDASRNKDGGWPAGDLISSCPVPCVA